MALKSLLRVASSLMEKASSIIARMVGASNIVHEAVATYLEGQSVEMTHNKNGYFVDLMKLSQFQLDELDLTISNAETIDQGAQRGHDFAGQGVANEDDLVTDAVGKAEPLPVDVFAAVNSKTVMDKINDILKKHIPPSPIDSRKKPNQSYKRTMVVTHRRTEGYEPRFNELAEEAMA